MTLRAVRITLLGLMALEACLAFLGPDGSEHRAAVEAALAAKDKPEWWDDAALGVHFSAWVNFSLLSLLLFTSQWWTRPMRSPRRPALAPSARWFWPLTLAVVLVALGLRLPLASRSLWWDEAWVVQQVSHGKWKPDSKKPDALKFMAHDWKRCAFYYQKPTNHAPMALAQKASLTAWQKLTGSPRAAFSDLAARVPALLASAAAVVLMALLLRDWERPGAGLAAALVLALHPWHLRYGVDARGYALVVPLCLAGLLALTRVLRSGGGSARAWIAWGLVEFLWLWANPLAALDVALLNLTVLGFLLRGTAERSAVIGRWFAVHVAAAACFIHAFLPNFMQARRWAGQEADAHVLDADLLVKTLANLVSGMDPGVPGTTVESLGLAQLNPSWLWGWAGLTLVLLALLGRNLMAPRASHARGDRSLGAGAPAPWLLASLFASTAGLMLLSWALHSYFYPRFAIALLPCAIITVVSALARPGLLPSWGAWALRGGAAASFLTMVWPAWVMFTTRPIAPLRDAASFVQQQATSSGASAPLVACYGLGREALPLYEPGCLPTESAAELTQVMERAKTQQRPLFVIQGYTNFNRQLLPEGFQLLDNRSLFREVAAFPGIESEFYFRVYQLQSPPQP